MAETTQPQTTKEQGVNRTLDALARLLVEVAKDKAQRQNAAKERPPAA